MAEQISSIQIKGRLLNISYYKAKHMKRGVARMTDPNASQRAKTSPEYATFRAYGKEFGMTGEYVSKLLDSLPYREQYMLNPNRTADITRFMMPYLAYDTANPLGQRNYRGDNLQTPLVQYLQRQAKINANVWLGGNYEFSVADNLPSQPSLCSFYAFYNDDLVRRFQSLKIDGFYYNLYGALWDLPIFVTVTNTYTPVIGACVERVAGSWALSSGLDCAVTNTIPFTPDGNTYTKFAMMVLRPYRLTDDGTKSALIEYCTVLFARIKQEPLTP